MQHKKRIIGHARRLSQHTKVRFVAVGALNTFIDFAIFNLFVAVLSTGIVIASIVSTTVAMAISYLLNHKAVFRSDQSHSIKQIVLFLIVTLSGIWIIQTLIMVQVLGLLERLFDPAGQSFLLWFLQNVAKAFGVVCSAVWNYLGYSRLVFRKKEGTL